MRGFYLTSAPMVAVRQLDEGEEMVVFNAGSGPMEVRLSVAPGKAMIVKATDDG